MNADFIEATHNGTGGTGTLTLVGVTGSPNFDAFFAGTRLVSYVVNEYTDSTFATLSKSEAGVGSLVTSTLVLTRTQIERSWDGTNLYPNFSAGTAPSAVSFGNTAANVRIFIGPLAAAFQPAWPHFCVASGGAVNNNIGVSQTNAWQNNNTTITLTSNAIIYFPVTLPNRQLRQITTASVRVVSTVADAASFFKAALYEIASNGLPGKRLCDFGKLGTDLQTAATLSATLGTPIPNPGAFYVGALAAWSGSNPTFRGCNVFPGNPLGIDFTGTIASIPFIQGSSLAATTLPDPADMTGTPTNPAGSSMIVPLMAFK